MIIDVHCHWHGTFEWMPDAWWDSVARVVAHAARAAMGSEMSATTPATATETPSMESPVRTFRCRRFRQTYTKPGHGTRYAPWRAYLHAR